MALSNVLESAHFVASETIADPGSARNTFGVSRVKRFRVASSLAKHKSTTPCASARNRSGACGSAGNQAASTTSASRLLFAAAGRLSAWSSNNRFSPSCKVIRRPFHGTTLCGPTSVLFSQINVAPSAWIIHGLAEKSSRVR